MNRSNLRQLVNRSALVVGAIALTACLSAGAQTTATTPPAKPVPVKKAPPAHGAKGTSPAPAAKTSTPAPAAKTATQTTGATQTQSTTGGVIPASSQTVLAPLTSGATAATSTAGASTANLSNSQTSPASPSAGLSPAGGSRAPVTGQGVGSFVGAGWTLTAYGCFRSGTRLFCDFDVSHQSNVQARNNIWHTVNLVDDGGKITNRHNAFFVGQDGSQFPTAYVTPTPVRFVIEYDNVDQRYTSVSLVNGREQIQGVPITPEDGSQPAGAVPARASAPSSAPGKAVQSAVQRH
jgi:hypothetical protein